MSEEGVSFQEDGHSKIYLMDLATGDVHQLTEEGTRLTWPVWINDDEIILTVTATGCHLVYRFCWSTCPRMSRFSRAASR